MADFGAFLEGLSGGLFGVLEYQQKNRMAEEEHRQFERQMKLKELELKVEQQRADREDRRMEALTSLEQQRQGLEESKFKTGRAMDTAQLMGGSMKDLTSSLTALHRERAYSQSYGLDTSEIDQDINDIRQRLKSLPGGQPSTQPGQEPSSSGFGEFVGPPTMGQQTAQRMSMGLPTSADEAEQMLQETGTEGLRMPTEGLSGLPGMAPRYRRGMRPGSEKTPEEDFAAKEKAKTDALAEQFARVGILKKAGEEGMDVDKSMGESHFTADPAVNAMNFEFSHFALPLQIATGENGLQFQRMQGGKTEPITAETIIENPELAKAGSTALAIAKRHGQIKPEMLDAYERDILLPAREAANIAVSGLGSQPVTGYDFVTKPEVQKAHELVDTANIAQQAMEFAGGQNLPEMISPVSEGLIQSDISRFAGDLHELLLEPRRAASGYLLQRLNSDPSLLEDPAVIGSLNKLAQEMNRSFPKAPLIGSTQTLDPEMQSEWGKIFSQVGITVPVQPKKTGMAGGFPPGPGGMAAQFGSLLALGSIGEEKSTVGMRRAQTKPGEAEPVTSDQGKVGNSLLSQYARGQGLRSTIGAKEKTDYLPLVSWAQKASKEELGQAREQWKAMSRQHSTPEEISKQVDIILQGGEGRRAVEEGQPGKRGYQPSSSDRARGEAYQNARKALKSDDVTEFATAIQKMDSRELKLLFDDIDDRKDKVKSSLYKTWQKSLQNEIISRKK